MEKCAFCGNFQNILKGSDHINPKNNKSLTAESAVKPR